MYGNICECMNIGAWFLVEAMATGFPRNLSYKKLEVVQLPSVNGNESYAPLGGNKVLLTTATSL